jgi:hypothetical protein
MVARVLTIAVALLFAAGCEKTNHENIDKWTRTSKGPGKLKKAMPTRARCRSRHAAANPSRWQDNEVRGLEKMSPGRRSKCREARAALWTSRASAANTLPNAQRIVAKDAPIPARVRRRRAEAADRQLPQ